MQKNQIRIYKHEDFSTFTVFIETTPTIWELFEMSDNPLSPQGVNIYLGEYELGSDEFIELVQQDHGERQDYTKMTTQMQKAITERINRG